MTESVTEDAAVWTEVAVSTADALTKVVEARTEARPELAEHCPRQTRETSFAGVDWRRCHAEDAVGGE